MIEYHVPHDLHGPLADVLAARYRHDLESAEPARWLEAPLQLAHDLAARGRTSHARRSASRPTGPCTSVTRRSCWRRCPRSSCTDVDDPIATYRLQFVLDVLLEEELIDCGSTTSRARTAAGSWSRPATSAPPARARSGRPARAAAESRACRAARCGGARARRARSSRARRSRSRASARRFAGCARTCGSATTCTRAIFALGLGGLHFVWLAGGVAIGRRCGTASRMPCAWLRRRSLEPGRIVCQANFELVALTPPSPAQRLVLALDVRPCRGAGARLPAHPRVGSRGRALWNPRRRRGGGARAARRRATPERQALAHATGPRRCAGH